MDKFRNNWHRLLNKYNSGEDEFHRWMYEAKSMHVELGRLQRLFAKERKNELPKIHQQCSLSVPEKIENNHLTCCLGIKCAECNHLKALEDKGIDQEKVDEMKAFTCVAHILFSSGNNIIDTSEGYILTVDDRMFWNDIFQSLADGERAENDPNRQLSTNNY